MPAHTPVGAPRWQRRIWWLHGLLSRLLVGGRGGKAEATVYLPSTMAGSLHVYCAVQLPARIK
eukprot:15269048-Alexandrium_andersonii.AAC.1